MLLFYNLMGQILLLLSCQVLALDSVNRLAGKCNDMFCQQSLFLLLYIIIVINGTCAILEMLFEKVNEIFNVQMH